MRISAKLQFILFYFIFSLPETFNSLVRIAAVSSDGDKSSTQLALSLIREMLAIGIGNFGYIIFYITGYL